MHASPVTLPAAAASLALGLLAAPGAAAFDDPASGWSAGAAAVQPPVAPNPFGLGFGVIGMIAELEDGAVLRFDGETVERFGPDGNFELELATLPAPTFPALFEVAPDASYALIGESSSGKLYRLGLPAGALTPITTLANAFDAVFESPNVVIVSSACSTGCGTQLLRLDTQSGAEQVLATLDGPSGPVALGPDGDLYYGTISPIFAAQGEGRVLRFDAALLGTSPPLQASDAVVIGADYNTLSSLAVEPSRGSVLAAENDLLSGTHRILRVAPSPLDAEVVLSGTSDWWISRLRLRANHPGASFEPFQPAAGGSLAYQSSLYASPLQSRQNHVRPRRAELTLSGPGLGGAGVGVVTWSISGGPTGPDLIDALVAPMWCPLPLLNPTESTYSIPGAPPLHTGLDPFALVIGTPIPIVDGSLELPFWNPGLVNAFEFQGLLLTPDAALAVATTTSATL